MWVTSCCGLWSHIIKWRKHAEYQYTFLFASWFTMWPTASCSPHSHTLPVRMGSALTVWAQILFFPSGASISSFPTAVRKVTDALINGLLSNLRSSDFAFLQWGRYVFTKNNRPVVNTVKELWHICVSKAVVWD